MITVYPKSFLTLSIAPIHIWSFWLVTLANNCW